MVRLGRGIFFGTSAVAALAALACGTYGEDASVASSSTDAAVDGSPATDGSSPEADVADAGVVGCAHAFCESFDDTDGAAEFARWPSPQGLAFASLTHEDTTSPPWALRVAMPANALSSPGFKLEAPMPSAPKTSVSCSTSLRLVEVLPSDLVLAFALRVETADGRNVHSLFYVRGDIVELGTFLELPDGGSKYSGVQGPNPFADAMAPKTTKLSYDVASSAAIVTVGNQQVVSALGFDVASEFTKAFVRIIVYTPVALDAGKVDLRYDDVVCDVE